MIPYTFGDVRSLIASGDWHFVIGLVGRSEEIDIYISTMFRRDFPDLGGLLLEGRGLPEVYFHTIEESSTSRAIRELAAQISRAIDEEIVDQLVAANPPEQELAPMPENIYEYEHQRPTQILRDSWMDFDGDLHLFVEVIDRDAIK